MDPVSDRKRRQRAASHADDPASGPLTTDQGVTVDHTDDSLTVGERGPTLMEDFHFREKLTHTVDRALPTVASVLYDAVLLPGGPVGTPSPATDPDAMRVVRDAHRHGKPVAALGSGVGIIAALAPEGLRLSSEFHHVVSDHGVVTDTAQGMPGEDFTRAFVAATAAHRHWDRPRVRC